MIMTSLRAPIGAAAMILAAASIGTARADELTIGLAAEPSAMDPHYHNLGPNNAMRTHIFESLVWQDAEQLLEPQLAESWRTLDDTTWEFKLRQGVKFHDGTDFDAQDVIYTACRIPMVQDSPSSLAIYTKAIAGMEAPDPHTLIIKTDTPYPLLPTELANWGVLSAESNGVEGDITFSREGCEGMGEPPTTAQFNSGEAAIGTGPYKFVSFTPGDRIVLERNDDYWGEQPEWTRVTFRPITSDGPRVAALLAGDVDFIEKPPIQDLERIKSGGFGVAQELSNRVIYLHFDHAQEPSPGITGTDGKNPFKDVRVREAISKAINREAIVDRIMGGMAMPAGELLPSVMFGASPDAKPDAYDPEAAKALLTEAGYPDGFGLVIGSPNDRYINDAKIAQAVAQMLTRIGIETQVDAMTATTFFSRRNNHEFSLYLAGWGSGTGEMSSPLTALVATPDKAKGMGGTNAGQYSNPEMDALLQQALATIDDQEREKLLQQASQVVIDDYGILPLHFEITPWAFREGLTYEARADQYTLAMSVKAASS
jgi:peptide/nickel transport system substrate-binding protein